MRIAVGMPSMGTIHTKTVMSLVLLLRHTQHDLVIISRECGYTYDSRNVIVDEADKAGCDAIFFLDSDILCDGLVLTRLLQQEKLIIGAAYNYKKVPLESIVKPFSSPDAPFPCTMIGMGAMLIRMSVFPQLPRPYFFTTYDPNGVLVDEGEWFCRSAIRAGLEVWCDPTIKIEHLGEAAF